MVSPRQLAYRDRFVWELQQVVSSIFDDCDDFTDRFVFPDMTTRVPLVMYLSQEQWTTLYSAIMTGADLTYPNTSHDVENLFLQTVNCSMAQLCEAIADCISDSENTRNALIQFMIDMGYPWGTGNPEEPAPQEIRELELLPEGYVCTNDNAFGMSLAVVNSINDATTEILEQIEMLSNPLELVAEIGDNIPVVSLATSLIDIISWIQNTAVEDYVLAWSPTVRDELACLLWCQFKGTCSLSYEDIWDTYLEAANVTPPVGETLDVWLDWLIGLALPGTIETVARVSLLGLLAMRYGSAFGPFRLGIYSMGTVIAMAEDESSNDWSIVCDPCGPWCVEFDFTVSECGWETRDNSAGFIGRPGIWTLGEGWVCSDAVDKPPGGKTTRLTQILPSFTEIHITRVEMTYDYEIGDFVSGGPQPSWIRYRLGAGAWVYEYSATPDPDGTDKTLEWVVDAVCSELEVRITPSYTYKPPTTGLGSGVVTKIVIEGVDFNPFGGYECP